MTVRFLHTADWQLGMRRHFLSEEALPRFTQARIDALGAIARIAGERDCAFLVACGDVFESNQVERRTIGRAFEALAAAPCPVYLLPGNHDPLDAATLYRSREFARRPGHIHVLESDGPVRVGPGVEIVGVPWISKHPRKDLVAEALDRLEPCAGSVRVMAAHGIVDTLSPDAEDPARISVARVEAALADGRIHFLALGDRHSTTRVHERVWYSGTPEATDYREIDPGNVLVVELDDEACRVEPVRVGAWRFVERRVELGAAEDLDALEEWFDALPDKPRTLLKLRLAGALGLAARARLDRLLAAQGELLAGLQERAGDLAILPVDPEVAEMELSGFARDAFEELRATAQGEGDEALRARDALALLYRLRQEAAR